MKSKAEIEKLEINVIKVTKNQLKDMLNKCKYRNLGYSGIGKYHVRGYQHLNLGYCNLCRKEDYHAGNT